MSEDEKLWPCFVCKNNGFPTEMIILAGKDDRGSPIRKNPDKTPHTHKNKLGPRQQYASQQQQQATIPMTQPLSGNSFKTVKDQDIERMHTENQEDRKAYRDLMQQDINAKLQIAIAIKALAEAIKERGSTGVE